MIFLTQGRPRPEGVGSTVLPPGTRRVRGVPTKPELGLRAISLLGPDSLGGSWSPVGHPSSRIEIWGPPCTARAWKEDSPCPLGSAAVSIPPAAGRRTPSASPPRIRGRWSARPSGERPHCGPWPHPRPWVGHTMGNRRASSSGSCLPISSTANSHRHRLHHRSSSEESRGGAGGRTSSS